MPTSTRNNQTDYQYVEPRDRQLYTREGFDRKQIRYEFANSNPLELSDRQIKNADQLYVNHETVEFSEGPTGIGEGGDAGVSFLVEQGDEFPTTRYAKGFTVDAEELEAGATDIRDQRDALLEMFDFEHDARFLTGYDRGDGTWIPGLFEWLDNNIPSERVLDCSSFTYDGVEENVIKFDAFNTIDNRLMSVNSPMWGAMVGSVDALNHFSKVNDGSSDRSSYWQRINVDQGSGVGVNRRLWMPDELQFDRVADGQDPFTKSLTAGNSNWDGLGTDECYLLPDMDEVRANYWQLYEIPEPRMFSNEKDMGKRRFDYIDRYAHQFDPLGQHSEATDAVKLTNISSLFA